MATLILENLLADCFLTAEWERPFQLMQDYQKHFFFLNSLIMKHFWSGDQETESAIYPRCQNSQPVSNGITTFCYSNLGSGVISFDCFFTSLTRVKKNSSSRKQITEIKGEGMIAGYCYSCSQFLPTPPPINNY